MCAGRARVVISLCLYIDRNEELLAFHGIDEIAVLKAYHRGVVVRWTTTRT